MKKCKGDYLIYNINGKQYGREWLNCLGAFVWLDLALYGLIKYVVA